MLQVLGLEKAEINLTILLRLSSIIKLLIFLTRMLNRLCLKKGNGLIVSNLRLALGLSLQGKVHIKLIEISFKGE